MKEINEKKILLLVDGHSLAFRSFYAFSKGGENGLSTQDGRPTSVTYGFLKALLENCKNLSPNAITIAFDTAEPTFRHKADKNYKANRDVAPDIFFQDLEQLQGILEQQLGLPICIAPGYEADDILGTLSEKSANKGWAVRILSGDRDLFQLVDDKRDIAVLYMGGGPYAKSSSPALINEAGVITKLGVSPGKVIDLKALTGDSSDNIPGVKGVGPKTAINLLNEHRDLDSIYKCLNQIEVEGIPSKGSLKGALKDKLKKDRENAYLSRFLAEILIDIPLSEDTYLELGKVNKEGLKSSLEDLELNSLVRKLPEFISVFSSERPNNFDDQESKRDDTSNSLLIEPKIISSILDLNNLNKLLMQLKDSLLPVSFDTETTDINPFKAELVGLGFCWGEGKEELAYIPIGHNFNNEKAASQIPIETVLNVLTPWIESSEHKKVLQNAKFDRLILMRHGISLNGVVIDTLLADYLIDSNAKHSLESLALREYNFKPKAFSDLVKKGENFSEVSIIDASQYCCMDVHLTRKLAFRLREKLEKMGSKLLNVLEQIEQPLEPVLALMEATGIRIDIPYLKELSKELSQNLNRLEKEAHDLAGLDFNLASPKQLSDLLFNQLALDKKKSRKTKTGWSTDVNVLEKLESEHPVVKVIIEHRVLSKLRSTYVDALPQLIEIETGRVHTDFNQAVTATGRLSSSNPNLQNIPIRTEFSRRIRKAFLPQEEWMLLSADYSQIELRILAHLSGEEELKVAYKKGDDVHSLTARILLEKEDINEEERRLGKTINFGVIYGMGAQRFARSTGLSQSQAKEFLALYKKRYPKVFSYLELQERLALSQGYVETLMGRRRAFHFNENGLGRHLGKDPFEIDLDMARRGGMEAQQLRAAANAPIQGSCADIIKVAMVNLQEKITAKNLPARLLLQVHDELVLEVKADAIEEVKTHVVNTMENALALDVPLVVETGYGGNWMEAK